MNTTYTILIGLACVLPAAAQTDSTATNPPAVSTVVTTVIVPETNTVTVQTTVDAASTNAPTPTADTTATTAVGIPQIKFSDVPITTAIENLARLANINYMLDPKIGYGQADANGQIKVEPILSIRWENITAENALLALLDNYGLQLMHDKRTGIDRITVKDPSAPPAIYTKIIQLKYAGVSNLLDAAQSVLTDKRSRVLPDIRTSQMIVVATDPEQSAVEALITSLDKPTRQVLIETKLVEISSNPTSKKGVDWSGTLAGQNLSFGNNVNGGQSGNPYSVGLSQTANPPPLGTVINTTYGPNNTLNAPGLLADTAHGFNPGTFFLNADGVHAVLSFLNASSDAQVVSTPRVVTLDNEMATIEVTRAFPVINVTAGTANSAGGSSIAYSNIGTILNVTPRISANDYIWLKVQPEVSSFFGKDTESVGGGQVITADIFDTRRIDTQVMIPNANTLVMGGLVKDNPQNSTTKVPFLGDIPGLGWAFRSSSQSSDKDNLLIFITPTILQDSDFNPTKTDFLTTKPIKMQKTINPNSPADGANPYNWSDPKNTDPTHAALSQPGLQ